MAAKWKPDIVGCTATTSYVDRATFWAERIRKHVPNALMILGGVHITAIPEKLPDVFDIGVKGEGELWFADIIDGKIGIEKGKVYQGTYVSNLDTLPLPARDLFDMEYYTARKQTIRGYYAKATQIMSSRGCPFNCSFCGNDLLWHRKVRFFSAEYLIDELRHLVKTYGVEAIFVQDDIFVVNQQRFERFVEMKSADPLLRPLIYSAQLRANITTKDNLKLLKESGCVQVEFGFESGSDRVLKQLKGNSASVEQNMEAAVMAHEMGLRVLGTFMFGEPTETVDDANQTIEFIKKVPIDFGSCFMLAPYPGTQLWQLRNSDKVNWSEMNMVKTTGYEIIPRGMPRAVLMRMINEGQARLNEKANIHTGNDSSYLIETMVKKLLGKEWERFIPYCVAFCWKKYQQRCTQQRRVDYRQGS